MTQNFTMYFDPTKLTGTEGFMNYKLSRFGSRKRNNGGGNSSGSWVIVVVIIFIFILLKACSG